MYMGKINYESCNPKQKQTKKRKWFIPFQSATSDTYMSPKDHYFFPCAKTNCKGLA